MTDIPFPKLLNRALNEIAKRADREAAEAIMEAIELLDVEGHTLDIKGRRFVSPEQPTENNKRFVKPCWWERKEWQRER